MKKLTVSILAAAPLLFQWPAASALADEPTLESRTLAAILNLAPLNAPRETFVGWEETSEQRLARYVSISHDIAVAVAEGCLDRDDEVRCQRNSTAFLLGVAWHESGFAFDVDSPLGCYRKGWHVRRCDRGRSVSMWQLQYGTKEELASWKADRGLAAKAALRYIRRSLGQCRKLTPVHRLSVYATGTCDSAYGWLKSRELSDGVYRAEKALAWIVG